MLKIRLQRVGRKHEPVFRLVLTDSENATKSGKYKEMLGSIDLRKGGDKAVINTEKVTHWLSVGARPTDTVHNLLVDRGILKTKKINKLPLKKAIKKDVPVEEVKPAVTEPESKPEVKVEQPVAETPKEDIPTTQTEEAPTV